MVFKKPVLFKEEDVECLSVWFKKKSACPLQYQRTHKSGARQTITIFISLTSVYEQRGWMHLALACLKWRCWFWSKLECIGDKWYLINSTRGQVLHSLASISLQVRWPTWPFLNKTILENGEKEKNGNINYLSLGYSFPFIPLSTFANPFFVSLTRA